MNLELVVEKLSDMAKQVLNSKGPVELFGLFLRDDSQDLWDVVIAAPWLKADKRASFEYVAGELRARMTDDELAGLSRIVILEHNGAVLKAFLENFSNHTGLTDIHFVAEGGAVIRRAYIIVAHPVSDAAGRRKTKKPHQRRAPS